MGFYWKVRRDQRHSITLYLESSLAQRYLNANRIHFNVKLTLELTFRIMKIYHVSKLILGD